MDNKFICLIGKFTYYKLYVYCQNEFISTVIDPSILEVRGLISHPHNCCTKNKKKKIFINSRITFILTFNNYKPKHKLFNLNLYWSLTRIAKIIIKITN